MFSIKCSQDWNKTVTFGIFFAFLCEWIILKIYFKPISCLIRILIFSISNVFFSHCCQFCSGCSEKYITILLHCYCFLHLHLLTIYIQIWHLSICSCFFTFWSPLEKDNHLFYALLQYMWVIGVCECYALTFLYIYDKSVQSLWLFTFAVHSLIDIS